eukprot:gene23188-29383_t
MSLSFTLLAGEAWLTTIALDLVYSLTNPFISYKSNLKKYQIIGRFDQGVCWVKITSTNSPCLWGYFLFWMVCMYAYQIWAAVFAALRLRKGLPLTFEVRKKCAQETFTCLFAYAVYISSLMFIFAIISTDPSPEPGSSMSNFSLFFLFIIANRGSVDGIVWFMLHDFERDGAETTPAVSTQQYSQLEQGGGANEQEDDRASTTGSSTHGLIHDVTGELHNVQKKMTATLTEIADLAIAELDETDLSPQVNTALRQQIVQYVTKGVNNAIRKRNIDRKPNSEFKDIMDNMFRRTDPALVDGLQVLEFVLEDEHPFKAFAPDMFKALRLNEGIDDDKYLRILSASANERLSEGASGAFMFFCGGGEFIVKTIKPAEAKVLHASLNTYSKYLKNNSNSLLCRFLGSYSLEMYSQTFYFVVMLNCFDPAAYINERFDIKGSWVGRSAEPAKRTKKVVCRHCNEYFVPARGDQCLAIVGKHEANVVLKDNDLRTKISLPPDDASAVVEILRKDSELLSQLGVLDYSLLLGIKKWKFEVQISDEMMAFNPKGKAADVGKGAISPTSAKSTYRAKTVSGPAVYHLGIVDFLQDWTLKKRLERAFKIYFTRKDPDGLSVMAPEAYQRRFQGKMEQIFDLDGVAGGVGFSSKDAYSANNSSSISTSSSSSNNVSHSFGVSANSSHSNAISAPTIGHNISASSSLDSDVSLKKVGRKAAPPLPTDRSLLKQVEGEVVNPMMLQTADRIKPPRPSRASNTSTVAVSVVPLREDHFTERSDASSSVQIKEEEEKEEEELNLS